MPLNTQQIVYGETKLTLPKLSLKNCGENIYTAPSTSITQTVHIEERKRE